MRTDAHKNLDTQWIISKTINFLHFIKNRAAIRLRKYILPISYELALFSPYKKEVVKKKLLIVRIDAIGDFVIFSPFLPYYRELFKDYDITLLVNKINTPFAERYLKDGTIDSILTFDRMKSGGFTYTKNLLQSIKSKGFTIAIYPVYSREIMGDYLVAISAASKRIGYDGDYRNISHKDREKTDTFYTKLLPSSPNVLPEPERNKEFLQKLAIELRLKLSIGEYLPSFTPTASDIHLAEELLLREGYDSTKKYIVVCPGSSDPQKNWQVEKFAEIILTLHRDYGVEAIVGGSPAEKTVSTQLQKLLPFPIINLAGKTTLPIFGAACTKAIMYLGNDTGTTHIAAATGLTTVSIVGEGIDRFFPYGNPETHIAIYDEVLYAQTASQPTLRYQSMRSSEKNVTVAQVLGVIRKILDQIL